MGVPKALTSVIVFVRCETCEMTFRDREHLKRHRIAHEPEVLGRPDASPKQIFR